MNEFKMKAEDFGLNDNTTINDVDELRHSSTNTNSPFMGFSKDISIKINVKETKITTKMKELYLCQLAWADGILGDIEKPRNSREFQRVIYLDTISNSFGFEENTLRNSRWGFCYMGDEKQIDSREAFLDVARFYGFIKAINTDESLYALRQINERARSGYGHNSPKTRSFVHEYKIVRFGKGKFNSPYKLERLIWATKNKALVKHKVNITLEDALRALGVTRNSSKAATVAVYYKLGLQRDLGVCKSFRHARDSMCKYYAAKMKSKGDFVLDNSKNEFKYSYRLDGSYSIVTSNMSDIYRVDIDRLSGIDSEEKSRLPNISKLNIGELEKMEFNELRKKWEFIIKEYKSVPEGTLYRVKTTTEIVYHLDTDLGLIEGWDYRGCRSDYILRLFNNMTINDLDERASKSNSYLYLVDSYNVGNCVTGTSTMMEKLGIDKNRITIPIHKIWQLAIEKGVNDEELFKRTIIRGLMNER